MTTPALATDYEFTAEITGKGQTPSGTPYLQFDWKLPGSQYPFQLLLGREPEVYDAWNVSQVAWVSIHRGGTKTGKTGEYSTDYFYNLASIGDGDASDIAPPAAAPTLGRTPETQTGGYEAPTDVQTRIEIGQATNLAVQVLDQVFSGSAFTTEEMCQKVREYRDAIYHEVIRVPVAPPHYCYEHEKPRIQGKTKAWGHREEDGFCMEDSPGITVPEASGPPQEFNEPPQQRRTRPAPAPPPEEPPEEPPKEPENPEEQLPF